MKSKMKNQKSKMKSDPQSDALRILILEDVPTDAELVERAVRDAGITFTPRCVETRDDFVKQLEDFSPDLVLSDYSMPQFTGMEALELVKQRYPTTPVIIVTGSVNEETAVECMKAGATDYVLKDNLTRLGQTVNRAMEKKRLREEKERAEEALRESENKYRLLIKNANDAIFIAQDECIKFPNPKTEEMIGYTKEELAKVSISDFIHPENRDMVLERHNRRLKGEELPSTYPFRVINKAGDELWVHLNTILITWEGRPATLNFLRDITEQRRLEAQLQQAQKMEAIGTLSGGIAHDFNNILAAIIGFAELVKMKLPEDSEFLPNLDQILKSGNRAVTLIQQILAFSRKQELEQKPLQLKYIVKETLKLLRSTLPTDIEIKEDIAKDIGVVNADPTQMQQVIMNLCTNAGHAMQEEGGVLAVGLANVELDDITAAQYLDMSSGHYLILSVSDTGYGMTSDVKDRIFDPYFTTKEKGVGTGLGLSVVHGIVKKHNGEITVYSEPGKGSTFHVYLPLIQEEAIESEIDEQAPILTGNERILFIDDEPTIVEIGKQMLERLGYKVTTRTSSIEALELFKAQPDRFDLVITDMTMPKMTGDKLAKELMKIRPDILIIICTGYSERISEEMAKGMGIKAFALKPLVMQDLANNVRKVLDEN